MNEQSLATAYQQTLDYLYETLPMFSRLGREAIKKDLTNILALCEALGHPENQFKSIHIAGTNGKGSTSHGIAAILQANGYKTGLYTSPHLLDFRERIRVDGQMVSKEFVVDFVATHRTLFETIRPSFFEVTVAMAFTAFATAGVDIAVIETGLGGRLDSTNIITPVLSVITNISYDHMDVLGNSLEEIAREKAGIIKEKIPVIIGEEQPHSEKVFFEKALAQQSQLYYADSMWELVQWPKADRPGSYSAIYLPDQRVYALETDLLGSYQTRNLRTMLAAATLLPAVSDTKINLALAIDALKQVHQLTGIRGRWEQIQKSPLVIADVAHNADGLQHVINQWERISARNKHVVIGFVRDKDVFSALQKLPRNCSYHFCNAAIPRALPAEELGALAQHIGLTGQAHNSVALAVAAAKSTLQQDDALLITGSFFVVGEALAAMEQ